MTKIWIMSDLHIDDRSTFMPSPPPDGYDVVVLAGDIHESPVQALKWAELTFMRPAIVVAGNHEYHLDGTYESKLKEGRELTVQGPQFLENRAVVIAGTRFLGCTLWTDFDFDGDQAEGMRIAGNAMIDFMLIGRKAGGSMTPAEILAVHEESIAWLDSQFAIPFDGPTVVVTHHAPSKFSVGAEFVDSVINPAFVSHLNVYLARWQPELWIHGHIHSPSDYMVEGTRVICNPKAGSRHFRPHWVVDVRKRSPRQRYENGVPVDQYGYPMAVDDQIKDDPDEDVATSGMTR
jgi:Icc-related predicted phosphoesterase